MNITFLADCQLLQKSLIQAQCPSADLLFPLERMPRTSCERLNATVTTIYTFYRTGNGKNVSILYYVVCEHLYVRHAVFRTIILESTVFKQFGFAAIP